MNDVLSISGDDGGIGWYENDLESDTWGSSSGKEKWQDNFLFKISWNCCYFKHITVPKMWFSAYCCGIFRIPKFCEGGGC